MQNLDNQFNYTDNYPPIKVSETIYSQDAKRPGLMTSSIFNITERNEESEVTAGTGSILVKSDSVDNAFQNLVKRKSMLSLLVKSSEEQEPNNFQQTIKNNE